jgi:hypothetical protein
LLKEQPRFVHAEVDDQHGPVFKFHVYRFVKVLGIENLFRRLASVDDEVPDLAVSSVYANHLVTRELLRASDGHEGPCFRYKDIANKSEPQIGRKIELVGRRMEFKLRERALNVQALAETFLKDKLGAGDWQLWW